jgi:putative transposase
MPIQPTSYRAFYRRHLPHWQPPGATLFITFRLAGSLPRAVLAALREQQEREERALLAIADVQERERQAYLDARRAFGRWDAALDAAAGGPRWLADPRIAAFVAEALHHRHDKVYDLLAFCVMSTHVHLVCTPLAREEDTYPMHSSILQSLKRHTARQANLILQRQGTFWQRESYDHVVRDDEELARIVRYVLNNPVKAGLVAAWQDWPWSYCRTPEGYSEAGSSEWHSDIRPSD